MQLAEPRYALTVHASQEREGLLRFLCGFIATSEPVPRVLCGRPTSLAVCSAWTAFSWVPVALPIAYSDVAAGAPSAMAANNAGIS